MATLRVAIDARAARTGAAEFKQAGDTVRGSARGIDRQATTLTSTLRRLGAVFGGAFAIGNIFRQIRDFEAALVGVGKTTDLTGNALRALGQDVTRLSLELPTPTIELLNIAQAAGQLGVSGRDNILAFTDTIAKLGSASDLSGEQAAVTLARLLNLTGETAAEVATLGAVITALGNNFAATESQIARTGLRVAQAGALYDFTSGQVVALGTALAASGVRAEQAGSTIGRTLRLLGRLASDGREILGAGFQDTFERDQLDGLREFLSVIRSLSTQDAVSFLESLGVSGEDISVLGALAKRTDELTRAVAIYQRQTEDATALNEEAARASATLSGALGRLANTWTAVITSFDRAAPVLANVVNTLSRTLQATFIGTERLTPLIEKLSTLLTFGLAVGATRAAGGLLRFVAAGRLGVFTALAAGASLLATNLDQVDAGFRRQFGTLAAFEARAAGVIGVVGNLVDSLQANVLAGAAQRALDRGDVDEAARLERAARAAQAEVKSTADAFRSSSAEARNAIRAESALTQREIEKQAAEAGEGARTAIEDAVAGLDVIEDRSAEVLRSLQQLGEEVGNIIGNVLEDLLFRTITIQQAIRAVFEEIARAAFRSAVTQPLSQALGGAFASLGSDLGGGGNQSPQQIGAGIGIGGTSLPETARSVNINVTSPDANGFLANSRQIGRDFA